MDANPIVNLDSYNTAMRKSLIDKIFFLDKVRDAKVFFDFGCADGSMLKLCRLIYPDHIYIGYDNNPEMIVAAKKDNADGVLFTDHLEEAISSFAGEKDKTCLILSSMIHEVYTYGIRALDEFWKQVWAMQCGYVAIRDMCVSDTASRPADPLSVARVRQLYDADKIAEWCGKWGALEENWSLVHFFLHYRYKENWVREVRENYLPVSKEKLLQQIPREYVPIFIEHFTLPFLREAVMADFGIQLQERTHLKLILQRSA